MLALTILEPLQDAKFTAQKIVLLVSLVTLRRQSYLFFAETALGVLRSVHNPLISPEPAPVHQIGQPIGCISQQPPIFLVLIPQPFILPEISFFLLLQLIQTFQDIILLVNQMFFLQIPPSPFFLMLKNLCSPSTLPIPILHLTLMDLPLQLIFLFLKAFFIFTNPKVSLVFTGL